MRDHITAEERLSFTKRETIFDKMIYLLISGFVIYGLLIQLTNIFGVE